MLFAAVPCKSEESAAAATQAATDTPVMLAEKDDFPAVGVVVSKSSSMKIKDAALKVDAGGQDITGTMSQTKEVKNKDEVIAPNKMRRIIESDVSVGSMTRDGAEQKVPAKPNPLLGMPVICVKNDGKWTAELEKGTPTEAQAEALDNMVVELSGESAFHMYGGGTPRKPGDEWKVDPAKIGFNGGKDLKGDYSVKFVEVKDHEGVKCAVLKATFDFTGKTLEGGAGGPEMSLHMKGEATSYRSLADRVDLEVNLNGTMTVSGSPGPAITMTMEGPLEMIQKSTVKRP